MLNFSQEDYSVSVNNEKVFLLRKEYYLLSYLYKNKGRAFSREEILDAVWSMEEPTDRTVDDHIYRLRKKLVPFHDILSIKTVKGFGYALEVSEIKEEHNITLPDEVFQQANQLLNMYYKYGHGKALRSLINNKELGFPDNDKNESVLYLLKSDFTSLLKKINSVDNKFIPLYLYAKVEPDKEKVISTFEDIINRSLLAKKEEMDIEYSSLPLLYLIVNKPKQSMKLVDKGLNEIQYDEKHGFFPLLKIMKVINHLFTQNLTKAKHEISELDQLLTLHPYQREQGILHVLKGLVLMKEESKNNGKELIERGRKIITDSGHTYYFLFIYQVLDLLLEKACVDEKILKFYEKEKMKYYKQSKLFELKEIIYDHVNNNIL